MTEQPAPSQPGHPLLEHKLRKKLGDAVAALSLANLTFITAWFTLLYDADFGYYNRLRVTPACLLALAVNLLGSAALFWFGVRILRHWQCRWLAGAACCAIMAAFALAIDLLRIQTFHIADADFVAFLKSFPGILIGLGGLAVFLLWPFASARLLRKLLLVFSPLAALTLAKVILLLLGVKTLAQHSSQPPPSAALLPGAPPHRVLWIIFDEMDQRVAFAHRPPSVRLPEFDRLRQEAICADNAYPPAGHTMVSLPALITGLSLTNVQIISSDDLLLSSAGTNTPVRWSTTPTVFSDARALGCNTALVGWFHPYGRVLGPALNSCHWYAYPNFRLGRGPTFADAWIEQIWSLLPEFAIRRMYVETCVSSLQDSVQAATNAHFGLVFLHLVPPHKPGVYVPDSGRFTILGIRRPLGYLNSLVLADRMLGTLRSEMERAGLWDQTWVLISSDHWWRSAPASFGPPDYRVPFILKPPRTNSCVAYPAALQTLFSHDLVLAILRGEVKTEADALAWLTSRPPPKSPTYGKPEKDMP